VEDIREIMRSFLDWRIVHTNLGGGGNGAAHIFAQMGVQHGSTKIWLDFISDCIRGIVSSESRTMFL
jgi:hypothetical protein